MAKAEATVEELVNMIERKQLRLPEMQREYVWKAPRVRDLLDSLYRDYPSGAILVWNTDEPVPERDFAISQNDRAIGACQLLLDGQQRLTSLSAVLRGEPLHVRGRKKPLELLFNLEHPDELSIVTEVNEDEDDEEERTEDETESTEDDLQKRFERMTFVVSTRRLAQHPHWVNVSEVFKSNEDASFLQRAGITTFADPRYSKYSQRLAKLRGIKKYVYRMDVLERELTYDEVTEIFVRVNSLGAKLRSSDLALAQITAKWRNSLKAFQAFQQQCARSGFPLELGIHLKNLIAFATGQSRFKTVGGLTLDQLQGAWKDACQGMEFAMNFLKNNAAIDSPALLSSPFIMVTLAYFGHKHDYQLDQHEAGVLAFWVLHANSKGRYSRGSSETILDQDLTIIRQGGGAGGLEARLVQQVGRFSIEPGELEGRNQRSALFKTMFLAFRHGGATDWRSNLKIAMDHSGSHHRLQFHHIFPKAVLKGKFTDREADDIANLSFIGGRTNRAISDKEPAKYFPEFIAKNGLSGFTAQCIPTSAELLHIDQYKAFLIERRRLIAERLNGFLGIIKEEGASV